MRRRRPADEAGKQLTLTVWLPARDALAVTRRDALTFILVLPFVATMPYLLPADAAAPVRFIVALGYLLIGGALARLVATRLTA